MTLVFVSSWSMVTPMPFFQMLSYSIFYTLGNLLILSMCDTTIEGEHC